MEASEEEGFVGVDVADAGKEALVEEEGLDGRAPIREPGVKGRGSDREGVGSEGGAPVVIEGGGIVVGGEGPEAARVDEGEGGAVVERPRDVGVWREWGLAEDEERAGHAQAEPEEAEVAQDGELLAVTACAADVLVQEEVGGSGRLVVVGGGGVGA